MMVKMVTAVGARPQIIKAAALSRAIALQPAGKIKQVLVHTGQHYDSNMSDRYFEELELPKPDYHFSLESTSPVTQLAGMILKMEEVLQKENPHLMLVYGDTHSTLAATIAAAKLNIPIAHVEAGLRSFNRDMPEEANRIACDHASTFLFAPTPGAITQLKNEGIINSPSSPHTRSHPLVLHSGDIMLDNTIFYLEKALNASEVLNQKRLNKNEFGLVTIHRNINTDNPENLQNLIASLLHFSKKIKLQLIFPVHPRTRKILDAQSATKTTIDPQDRERLIFCDALPYFDMLLLEKHCKVILTDSGGVQKEAFFLKKPCIVLRDETEWTELIEMNVAALAGYHGQQIEKSWNSLNERNKAIQDSSIFGNGNAATLILNAILNNFS